MYVCLQDVQTSVSLLPSLNSPLIMGGIGGSQASSWSLKMGGIDKAAPERFADYFDKGFIFIFLLLTQTP